MTLYMMHLLLITHFKRPISDSIQPLAVSTAAQLLCLDVPAEAVAVDRVTPWTAFGSICGFIRGAVVILYLAVLQPFDPAVLL